MSFSLVVVLAGAGLLAWVGLRAWQRRAGAGRLDAMRTMTGDADLLRPDHESTLTIGVQAPPTAVWGCLLQMGRGERSQRTTKPANQLSVGDAIEVSFAPPFPILGIDPGRTLLLGGERYGITWRWQFELYALEIGRTRLISRARVRAGKTVGSSLFALALGPIAFIITRKMLLDVKRRAEGLAIGDQPSRAA
jgi:hypothetical protein